MVRTVMPDPNQAGTSSDAAGISTIHQGGTLLAATKALVGKYDGPKLSSSSGSDWNGRGPTGSGVPADLDEPLAFRTTAVGAKPPVSTLSRTASTLDSGSIKDLLRSIEPSLRSATPAFSDGIRIQGLESWTGTVRSVDDEIFTAELVPNAAGPRLVADFHVALLGDDETLEPGDVVYVTVRTVLGRGGHPQGTQSIRKRHIGRWSTDEVEQHKARASTRFANLADSIDWG